MEQTPSVDIRLEFLSTYVQKSLKLKIEKWSRMMASEEYKEIVIKFLERPATSLLVISLTPAIQLVASNSFPLTQLKTKGVFFVKKTACVVSKTKPTESVIMGDLSVKIIDQLASLVDEILVPLLSNEKNHRGWPSVISKDVEKHVHSLKSTVCQVKGQVNGQTVLPMPVGVEKVEEVEKALLESGGEVFDLYMKSAIEGVIIKWATQINDVLVNVSSESNFEPNPGPAAEMQFWSQRLKNLEYIFDQLREPRVKSMATILEKTNSAYYSCFKTLFKSIVVALAEAKDITIYLKPLQKHITLLEETDFSEYKPLLAPLMTTVCLIWANSQYYDQTKIITLLKQICNLLIEQAKRFLDPTTLFHSDVDEAMQRVNLSVDILSKVIKVFFKFKANIHRFFKEGNEPRQWNFHTNAVFERFNTFLDRLHTIQWFFNTVLEFTKLEKVEIGGSKGKTLSARVTEVSNEFQKCFAAFSGKAQDILDPDDDSFIKDFEEFKERIQQLDLKLSAILCQAFDDCCNLEAIYKFINIVKCILNRPVIKNDLTSKYPRILVLLREEILMAEDLFMEQLFRKEKYGNFRIDDFMPPVAGSLRWTYNLRKRILQPLENFKALQDPITETEEAKKIIEDYESLLQRTRDFDRRLFEQWAAAVPSQIEENLKESLVKRKPHSKELLLNFSPAISAIIREVRYLRSMEVSDIPAVALEIFEREDMFRQYVQILNVIIEWYNKIRRTTKDFEFQLIRHEIEEIDALIQEGQDNLNWNSEAAGLLEYTTKLHKFVGNLQQHIEKSQENIDEIRNIFLPFVRQPLFQRKDKKKDAILAIEDRKDKSAKRIAEIEEATEKISLLLTENMELFEMKNKEDDPKWINYINYVDKIIFNYLYQTIGCSLGYINEHMDPINKLAPLFETELVLEEPDIVFKPSLEQDEPNNFKSLVTGLIEDIIVVSSHVSRFSKTETRTYREEIEANDDIKEIKADILSNVDDVIKQAFEFCDRFRNFSYLWLDDRHFYMEQFLTYGRQLTPEEMELVQLNDSNAPKPSPPGMECFREQIDNFESLFNELESLKTEEIFNCWFKVNVRPFKQALLNTVCKWCDMFKQHLVDTVTNSLCDLSEFIRSADEGLQQTVNEGDYDALVNVMGYLLMVKERQAITDQMFDPLRETIDLLKFYDQDIPEEVNVLLQELPEQWNSTKKIAVTIKQQLAPLQAIEVANIRKRITDFESRITYYREVFKRYEFFQYSCKDPYSLIDFVNKDIVRYEKEMAEIQKSGSLFEVNVPDFKLLKQCRKELRMVKQLWDFINIVHSCVDDWKTTPWRKIDVENMDIECKKFAKDVKLLDKDMRSWDAFMGLEATVKNTLTSLRAVGELQNPAIRERHWNQLMQSTKNLQAVPVEFKVRKVIEEYQ